MKRNVTDWEILSKEVYHNCDRCGLETKLTFDINVLVPKDIEVVLNVDHATVLSEPQESISLLDKLRWFFK